MTFTSCQIFNLVTKVGSRFIGIISTFLASQICHIATIRRVVHHLAVSWDRVLCVKWLANECLCDRQAKWLLGQLRSKGGQKKNPFPDYNRLATFPQAMINIFCVAHNASFTFLSIIWPYNVLETPSIGGYGLVHNLPGKIGNLFQQEVYPEFNPCCLGV